MELNSTQVLNIDEQRLNNIGIKDEKLYEK